MFSSLCIGFMYNEWMNDIVYERANGDKHTIIFSRYTRTRQIFQQIVHAYRLQFRDYCDKTWQWPALFSVIWNRWVKPIGRQGGDVICDTLTMYYQVVAVIESIPRPSQKQLQQLQRIVMYISVIRHFVSSILIARQSYSVTATGSSAGRRKWSANPVPLQAAKERGVMVASVAVARPRWRPRESTWYDRRRWRTLFSAVLVVGVIAVINAAHLSTYVDVSGCHNDVELQPQPTVQPDANDLCSQVGTDWLVES